MIAYILSSTNLNIKAILPFEQYTFCKDIDYGGKSSIMFATKPDIVDDDFVLCKDDSGQIVFTGICDEYSTGDSEGYTVELLQAECLFDRTIFVGTEATIASTGIEDFIAAEISSNWISSGDSLLDKSYLSVTATTHTPVSAKAATIGSVENGCYNLKTFLGNCCEKYGILLDFAFSQSSGSNVLQITVRKDSAGEAKLAVDVSDVSNFEETYDVDVLAKLKVKFYNKTASTTTYPVYYLKTNRTITTNASDPDRAEGVVSAIYIEAESQDEMYESVTQEFASNSYSHKISLNLKKGSRAYPDTLYYVGRKVQIKAKTGVKSTLVTETSETNESSFISLVFGKLKVTLIEKLRSL